MKTIKGYTLVDVLFAMMFTGIVVALSTMAYSIIIKNTFSIQKTKQKISDEYRLQNAMERDIWGSDSLHTSENGFIVYKDTNMVSYLLSDESLIRDQKGIRDTFLYEIVHSDFEDGKWLMEYELLGIEIKRTVQQASSIKNKINKNAQELVDRYQ